MPAISTVQPNDGLERLVRYFANPNSIIIPESNVKKYYQECWDAFTARSWTPATQACRTLLMYVAVSKGANEGEPFKYYIEYLVDNRLLPEDAKHTLNKIWDIGGDAVHKVQSVEPTDAHRIMYFSAFLLRYLYELPTVSGTQAEGN